MSKSVKGFDFSDLAEEMRTAVSKKDPAKEGMFGTGDTLVKISSNPEDYVVLPEWFKESYGILGIPFGSFIQIAGEPDSGKTSLSLLAMRCAQEQGYAIIYAETEGKTGEQQLLGAGLNPKGILTVQTNITEYLYDGIREAIQRVSANYPDSKILLVLDSYGNTTSMRDSELELSTGSEKPGGHAKTNRTGIGMIKANMLQHPIAALVVNYTYDNIGSVGKTNAGGKALNFHAMLTIQSSRKSWYERTVAGNKVRAGAEVLWKTYKNHFTNGLRDEKGNPVLLPKQLTLRISSEGMELLKFG